MSRNPQYDESLSVSLRNILQNKGIDSEEKLRESIESGAFIRLKGVGFVARKAAAGWLNRDDRDSVFGAQISMRLHQASLTRADTLIAKMQADPDVVGMARTALNRSDVLRCCIERGIEYFENKYLPDEVKDEPVEFGDGRGVR